MVVSVILFLILAASANPGILIGFSPEIVNSVLKGVLPTLESSLKLKEFPNIEFPVVSSKGASTDMVIQKVKFENIQLYTQSTGLVFKPTREITLNIPDLIINLSFDWMLISNPTKKRVQEGKAKIIISKASVLIGLLLNEDLKDVLKLEKCEFKIEKIEVVMDNNPSSSVVNWVLDAVNRKMKANVEKEIDGFLKWAVGDWVDKVQSFDNERWIAFSNWLELNAKVTEPILIDSKHIEVKLDGTFRQKSSDYEIEVPYSDPLVYETQELMAVYISEYTVNTLALSHFKTSPLSISSTSLGIHLTTKSLSKIFPSITSDFGESSPCTLTVTQLTAPTFSISQSSISTSVPLPLTCILSSNDSPILSLSVKVDLSLFFSISNGILTGSFSKLSFTQIDLVETFLSTEPDMENLRAFAKGLQFFLRSLLTSKVFGAGIAMPGFVQDYFPDLELSFEAERILIETNINI